MTTTNPLADDLDGVLDRTADLWDALRDERVLITGGTGFFGCWLLESLAWANARLGLGVSAVVLTRDPEAFHRKAPHLAGDPAIRLLAGDVRTFDPPAGGFGSVIHAATDASAAMIRDEPLRMLDTIVGGTRHVLDVAVATGARRVLLASSGAVYGRQPAAMPQLDEGYAGAPDPMEPGSAYGEGKRLAELLGALYLREHGVETVTARCFAFIGPYLPLDAHFAAGNFLRDRLAGQPVHVRGDGTARRSWLYAADLATCLWTLLLRGTPGRVYNVGSDADHSVAELAQLAATAGDAPRVGVQVDGVPVPGASPDRYVPSVRRLAEELGVAPVTSLREGVERTLRWHRSRGAGSPGT